MMRRLIALLAALLLAHPVAAQVVGSTPTAYGGAAPFRYPIPTNGAASVVGDSILLQYTDGAQRQYNAGNIANWAGALTFGRFVWIGNYAVAGTRSDQWGGQIASAIADGSKTVMIGTGVNDISAGRTGAQVLATMTGYIDQIVAAKKLPIVIGMIGAAGFSAAQVQERDAYNAGIAAYLTSRGVYVDAASAVLVNASPGVIPVWKVDHNALDGDGAGDGVHPSTIGARAIGQLVAVRTEWRNLAVMGRLPTSNAATASQLIANGLFGTQTGGTAYGSGVSSPAGSSAPAGWSITRSGSTGQVVDVVSFAGAPGLGTKVVHSISFVAPSSTARLTQTYNLLSSGLAGGSSYKAVARLHVPAGQRLKGVSLMMQWTVGGSTSVVYDMYSLLASTGNWPTVDVDIPLETPALPFPVGTATLAEMSIRIYPVTGETNDVTVEVSQTGVNKQ